MSGLPVSLRTRFNVAADRRRRRPRRRANERMVLVGASTWPPTVVGGDAPSRTPARTTCSAASTWPPTVVGGDRATPIVRSNKLQLQRGRRPSSAETSTGSSTMDTRHRASTWPPTVVGGDRPTAEREAEVAERASTWPPTVVGGDARGHRNKEGKEIELQRGRRPSSAETVLRRPRVVGFPSASTWPPTVVGGDSRSAWPCRPRTRCFNVAADRRRRRPAEWAAIEEAAKKLQRGRRPSSAETSIGARATGPVECSLQRGRRPSSAETPRHGARRGRRADASTWPPTVVGGDLRRAPCPVGAPLRASTWPPTVVGGDDWRCSRSSGLPGCRFNVAADRRRRRRPGRRFRPIRFTSFNVAADRRRRRPGAACSARTRCKRLQRGRRPSSAETSMPRFNASPIFELQRGRRPSSAETSMRSAPASNSRCFNVAADRRRRRPAVRR